MLLSRGCISLRRHSLLKLRLSRVSIAGRRHASSSASTTVTSTSHQPSGAVLASITNELDQIAPRFDINAADVEILRSPSSFFGVLKTKISQAKKRIFLSTLYIGKSETELITTIRDALEQNPSLHVSILTDALRGTREAPNPSCASLLLPLVEEFGSARVELAMYHTPNLVGTRKRILPKRINEGWGLQHMKLYGVDDEIIMSGANLSEDYFTNRQDRYHIFKSKDVTDYFATVHNTVCRMSYRVTPSTATESKFELHWPSNNIQPAPLDDAQAYVKAAGQALQPLLQSSQKKSRNTTDTVVYPLLQLTPLLKPDKSTELPAISSVLQQLAKPELAGSRWTFTAGYFNMTKHFRDLLLNSNPASATVIGASPWANGFYGSKGISGMLPAAYTLISRRFVEAVVQRGLHEQISVKEWRRGTVNTPEGWTYHAKGIWITLPDQKNPSLSVVGSSNYTKRSYSLDLEANAMVVTSNADLQQRYKSEEEHLQEYATSMKLVDYTNNERRVGLHVRLAMWIVSVVGGAL